MDRFSNAQQMLYRDKILSGNQLKTLVDATRKHMQQYVTFDDQDYSMVATISDGVWIDISIKVKTFLPIVDNK